MHDWEVILFLIGVIIQSIAAFHSSSHKENKENKDDSIKELKDERDYWHRLYLKESKECEKLREKEENNDSK